MDSEFQYDVFISYSHIDQVWVNAWLLPQLEEAHLYVCIDMRDFIVGASRVENIERAILLSRHTLLVLTPAWVSSEWTGLQARVAQTLDPDARQLRLIPLLLQRCTPPPGITSLTYADFTNPQQYQVQFGRLLNVIQNPMLRDQLGPALDTLRNKHKPQTDRHRKAMIAHVRAMWIAQAVDRSITKDARIVLGLEARPDAVIHPIDWVVQRPKHLPAPLPARTALIDIYDQFNGTLLILGAPGAGKTTLLLELARDLLDRAATNPADPIPVVFPLSTWATQRRPLVDWLVDELVALYQVSHNLAQTWINDNDVLPLLDGLDEVAPEHRNACADAINRYYQTRGYLPLVVCSRIADYEALTTQFQFHGAILAQPLSREQVRTYLRAVGIPAIPAPSSLLWELLNTPLMLTTAALAYAGQSLDALATADPIAARHRLFTAYIDRMFTRNNPQRPFTDAETRHYLAYLAHQLQRHNQTAFYLEQMQPNWLPRNQKKLVGWLVGRVIGLGIALLVGLGIALLVGLGMAPLEIFWLIIGLGGGLIGGLLSGLLDSSYLIVPVERLRWSWLRFSAILPVALTTGLNVGRVIGEFIGPVRGRVLGVLSGVGVALLGGLSRADIDLKIVPNQGIRRSVFNALVAGLGAGLLGGLLISQVFGPGVGLGIGLGLGIGFGLHYGGRAYLQHYLLRLLLIRNGSLPRRLVPFLDYATQRIFLRRVGGGYIFIHRLLLEHFAAQYEQEQILKPPAIQEESSPM